MHTASFPNFYLTDLGSPFLREYYRLVLEFAGGCLLVAEIEGRVVGFVAGFSEPAKFYRMMTARKWGLAVPIVAGMLLRPRLLPKTMRNVLRVRSRQQQRSLQDDRCWELSSIAVLPAMRSHRVGTELVQKFIKVAQEALAFEGPDHGRGEQRRGEGILATARLSIDSRL